MAKPDFQNSWWSDCSNGSVPVTRIRFRDLVPMLKEMINGSPDFLGVLILGQLVTEDRLQISHANLCWRERRLLQMNGDKGLVLVQPVDLIPAID